MKEYKQISTSYLSINYTYVFRLYFVNNNLHGLAYGINNYKGFYNMDMEYGHWMQINGKNRYYL